MNETIVLMLEVPIAGNEHEIARFRATTGKKTPGDGPGAESMPLGMEEETLERRARFWRMASEQQMLEVARHRSGIGVRRFHERIDGCNGNRGGMLGACPGCKNGVGD